jgi:hypothetical protein
MPQSLIILRSQDWHFNPLQCFLEDASLFLVVIVDLFARVLHLPPRARLLLSEVLFRLYDRFGIWRGQRERWPTLFDLVEDIRQCPSANPAAKDALLNRFLTLLLTLKPQRVAYRRGWSPIEMAGFSIDFEMRGATEVEKQLLPGCLLATVFHQKIERGLANATLSLLVACDDAQRFVSTDAEGDGQDTAPLAELASVGRSPGIGLWVDVQSLQGFSPRLLPNLANKFCGRLGSGTDYSAIAGHMSLSGEQLDYANHSLTPGFFLGQTSEGESRDVFLFTVPKIPELPPVSDAEASASCQPLRQLPVERAHEFDQWQAFPKVEIESVEEPPPTPLLDDAESRYLREVVERAGQPSSYYARAAGINGRRAARIRAKLVALGLVRQHTVALGTRGRNSIVLQPLAEARSVLHETQSSAEAK